MPKSANNLKKVFSEALRGAWRSVARPEQVPPPGDWTTWVFCGGRGAGKTRSGAEFINERVAGRSHYIHLIAPTAADCRDVLLEGPAGILTISPPHMRPTYQPSLRKVVWPNGAQALLFSSDEPDRLRGPQCDTLWIDELCAMRTAQEVLDTAMLGLRLGKDPRCLITTTPRPIKCFKALLARDGQDVVVTRSSSYANRENLAPAFFKQIVAKYEGTRLGKQEIEAQLLTDTPGALWHLERIEELRTNRAPPLERVVVSIDPAATHGPDADETGIIVAAKGQDGHYYVLDDLSGRYPPEEWARRAILAYRQHAADRVVAEVNQGGAMVESTLRAVDGGIPYRGVHAARGKLARAEPVSALYERGLVHHCGTFAALEDQMSSYDGSRSGASPDRLDALVWALHELALTEVEGGFIKSTSLLPHPSAADAAPTAIEMPKGLTGVFAMAAGAVGQDIDALGIVYFGFSLYNRRIPPLVILDWDIQQIEAATLDGWFHPVNARLAALERETEARCNGGCHFDPDGIGAVVWEQLASRGFPVDLVRNEKLLAKTIPQRAIAASARVNAGNVKLVRAAHEKMSSFKGAVRNHLVHQIVAFGAEQKPMDGGVLLAAFANGIYDAFESPELCQRARDDALARQAARELAGVSQQKEYS